MCNAIHQLAALSDLQTIKSSQQALDPLQEACQKTKYSGLTKPSISNGSAKIEANGTAVCYFATLSNGRAHVGQCNANRRPAELCACNLRGLSSLQVVLQQLPALVVT